MTGDKLTIRDFTDSDRNAVIVLARELQEHEIKSYDRMKPCSDIGEHYIDHLKSEVSKYRGRFLLAEHGGQVVGYATLQTHQNSAKYADEIFYKFAYVSDLAVSERARRRGIGTGLLNECERITREAGIKYLRLSAQAGNHPARNFYATLGFSESLILLEKTL